MRFEKAGKDMTLNDWAQSKMRTAEGYRTQFREFYAAAKASVA